jgi:hypothetical protein
MTRTIGAFGRMVSDRKLQAVPRSVAWSTLLPSRRMHWLNQDGATARDVNDDTTATFTDLP